MRRLTILAATLLMIAPVASAQITAGPVGPFAMVDSNGDLIGGALPVDNRQWAVAVNTPLGRGFVEIESRLTQAELDSFMSDVLYFESTNCTGQAYVRSPLMDGLDGGPKLLVNVITIYAITDDLASPVTTWSTKAKISGQCAAAGGEQAMMFPVSSVGYLSGFTPPFRIVTVASLTASVPMLDRMSHWLLAAALVACVVTYDRRRMVRLGLN